MSDTNRFRKVVRTLVLVVITGAFLFPVVWMLSLSIKPRLLLFKAPPVWIFHPVWDSYAATFRDSEFGRALVNSLTLAIVSTVLTVIFGTPAAYSLARLRLRARSDLMLFVIASRMAPPVGLVIPYFLLYKQVGLLDSRTGVVIAYLTFNLSFYIWLLSVMCRELPPDLEGAGELDGYSPFGVFRRITLPLIRPSIVAVATLVFIFSWNEFVFALILGGNAVQTLPTTFPELLSVSGVQWGTLSALATVAVTPVAILVFLLHKQIVRGLSMGAVRG